MTAYIVTWGYNTRRVFLSLEAAFAFRNKIVKLYPRLADHIVVKGAYSEEN